MDNLTENIKQCKNIKLRLRLERIFLNGNRCGRSLPSVHPCIKTLCQLLHMSPGQIRPARELVPWAHASSQPRWLSWNFQENRKLFNRCCCRLELPDAEPTDRGAGDGASDVVTATSGAWISCHEPVSILLDSGRVLQSFPGGGEGGGAVFLPQPCTSWTWGQTARQQLDRDILKQPGVWIKLLRRS